MSPRPTFLVKTPASVFARSIVGGPQSPLTAPFTPDLDSPFASPALRRLTAPVEQCSPWHGTVQSPHIMRRGPKLWSTSTGRRWLMEMTIHSDQTLQDQVFTNTHPCSLDEDDGFLAYRWQIVTNCWCLVILWCNFNLSVFFHIKWFNLSDNFNWQSTCEWVRSFLHKIIKRWINDGYLRIQLSSLFQFVILASCRCRFTGQWQPCAFPSLSSKSQAGAIQTKCPGSVPPEQKRPGTKQNSKTCISLSSFVLYT